MARVATVPLSPSSPRFSGRRSLTVLILAGLILYLAFVMVSRPIRRAVAHRFVERGDRYFAAVQFSQAEKEYHQALAADTTDAEAADHLSQLQAAEKDIVTARSFFEKHGADAVVRQIDEATAEYSSPKEALAAGIALYQAGEYQYARYPLEQAVQKDPAYPEAWHYLALTYDQLVSQDSTFAEKAKAARQQRDSLSAQWIGK